MDAVIKNDRRALGTLILYKILKKRQQGYYMQDYIWHAYRGLSNVLGDDFMEFPDFENFYIKLEKGECGVDYDEKPASNRNLSDMPADIIETIAMNLTEEEKWILRESSPSLRKMVDPLLPRCEKLEINIDKRYGKITWVATNYNSGLEIQYDKDISMKSKKMEVHRSVLKSRFEIVGTNLVEAMIGDIQTMLENPKTFLVDLDIHSTYSGNDFVFDHLRAILESQENIRSVSIHANGISQFHSILSSLKPKTLEEIKLKCHEENMDLTRIVKMDQLKQAKRLNISCPGAIYTLNNLMHLEEFSGYRNRLKPKHVLAIRNESTRTGNMKIFKIRMSRGMCLSNINHLLGPFNTEFIDSMRQRHFKIQNSDEFMKLEMYKNCIQFSREEEIVNLHPLILNLRYRFNQVDLAYHFQDYAENSEDSEDDEDEEDENVISLYFD